MQNNNNWDVIADNDDDELQLSGYGEAMKDVVLIAVDCSPSMLAPQKRGSRKKTSKDDEEDVNANHGHLFATLRSAVELQKRKALYGPDDMVGILLFNTIEGENGDVQERQLKPHISVFQPIAQVSADSIQNIISILDDAENGRVPLDKKFRSWNRHVPMGDVFSACNWLLRDQAPKTATKRVFLVTDEDNPHKGNVQLDRIAKQNLADLYALGTTVEPFFLSMPDKPFDVTKHYTEILSRGNGDSEDDQVATIPTVIDGFTRFLDEMSIREAPKRSQFSIKLTLGDGFGIGVKGYSLIVEQKKPNPKIFVDVDGELKEVSSKATYFVEGSLDETIQGPIVYGMSLTSAPPAPDGTEEQGALTTRNAEDQVAQYSQIYYTADDVRNFRTLGMEPGIKILGFKDADTLAFEDNIKHSYFIYPNDSIYKGSVRVFNALLKTLIAKNKIAITVALFRRNSSPYFYAMVPQEEVVNDDGIQERPPGFELIALPYADDIRAAPVEESMRASDELVQSAAAWIRKLKLSKGYQPDAYPNPTLNLFYSQLEAMALREEFVPGEFNDKTAPQTDLMLQRTGPLIETWKQALSEDPNANTYIMTKPGTKRKAEVGMDELEVRECYNEGRLAKLTVDTLKAFLRSKNLSTSGKKADLLERISDWFEKKGNK
ncbi:Ku DNA-binding complex, Ku70 subunit [Serendipita vermifera]|nr:Ku DNA-binding complex, Ku70 subunit [Serendipita vermifera]